MIRALVVLVPLCAAGGLIMAVMGPAGFPCTGMALTLSLGGSVGWLTAEWVTGQGKKR